MYPGTFLRMVIGIGLSPQTRLLRSSGCSYRGLRRPLHEQSPWSLPLSPMVWAGLCRSRSLGLSSLLLALNSLLSAAFLSRRFATGKPATDALMIYPGYAIFT